MAVFEPLKSLNIDFTYLSGKKFLDFNTVQYFRVWKNEKFPLTEKLFREIGSLVHFFYENVDFTKFLPKKCESEFPYFPHCVPGTGHGLFNLANESLRPVHSENPQVSTCPCSVKNTEKCLPAPILTIFLAFLPLRASMIVGVLLDVQCPSPSLP